MDAETTAPPPAPASSAAAPARQSNWLRILLLTLFVVCVLFVGQAFYYRAQIDARLSEAIRLLPKSPEAAAGVFRPVNRVRNWMTMGKVRDAQEQFLNNLRDSVMRSFAYTSIPKPEDFRLAMQTVAVVNELRGPMGERAEAALHMIARAAKEATERVRTGGTWSAHESAMGLFDYLRRIRGFTPEIVPNYRTWRYAYSSKLERRQPLILRDTEWVIAEAFERALHALDLPQEPERPLFAAIPATTAEAKFTEAETAFDQAWMTIENYAQTFPRDLPPEVNRWRERLSYNKAMLLLTHALDRGATLPRMGSDFMLRRMEMESAMAMPSPNECFPTFLSMIESDLKKSRSQVIRNESESDPHLRVEMQLMIFRGFQWWEELHQYAPMARTNDYRNPPQQAVAALDALEAGEAQQILSMARPQLILKIQ